MSLFDNLINIVEEPDLEHKQKELEQKELEKNQKQQTLEAQLEEYTNRLKKVEAMQKKALNSIKKLQYLNKELKYYISIIYKLLDIIDVFTKDKKFTNFLKCEIAKKEKTLYRQGGKELQQELERLKAEIEIEKILEPDYIELEQQEIKSKELPP